jgi:GTP 3',8-cyclase
MKLQTGLEDTHGRRFTYLRLSVTDACNFRCTYCLPNGYKKPLGASDPLTVNEITNLTQAFADLGTVKVRLTGGEPTLRTDLEEIARVVRGTEGIESVALSTNGFRLKKSARDFLSSGITKVNVSVDTLDRERFEKLTGRDQLPKILDGIDECLSLGFESVKLNAVLLADWSEQDLKQFQEFVRTRPVSVRFIELMPTAGNKSFFGQQHIKADHVRTLLMNQGWEAEERALHSGPAVEFGHPDYEGRIGLIAPYAKDFCTSCNRLRITSQGGLKLCLFGEKDHSLRPWLQDPSDREVLKMKVREFLGLKVPTHLLTLGETGNNHSFSAMGG